MGESAVERRSVVISLSEAGTAGTKVGYLTAASWRNVLKSMGVDLIACSK
jgi:hypothetical protein